MKRASAQLSLKKPERSRRKEPRGLILGFAASGPMGAPLSLLSNAIARPGPTPTGPRRGPPANVLAARKLSCSPRRDWSPEKDRSFRGNGTAGASPLPRLAGRRPPPPRAAENPGNRQVIHFSRRKIGICRGVRVPPRISISENPSLNKCLTKAAALLKEILKEHREKLTLAESYWVPNFSA